MWEIPIPKYPEMKRNFLVKYLDENTEVADARKLTVPIIIVPWRGVIEDPLLDIFSSIVFEYNIIALIPVIYFQNIITTEIQVPNLNSFLVKQSFIVQDEVSFWEFFNI